MRIIVNSYNTTGAGPSNITKFILKSLSQKKNSHKTYFIIPDISLFAEMESTEDLKIVRLPALEGGLKYIFRGLYDFLLLPIASFILNASAVIVLANYSPMIVRGKKIVFMRHPFLVDKLSRKYNTPHMYVLESMRKLIFMLTLKTADMVIVQNNFMKDALIKQYGKGKSKIMVMPNPMSNLMDQTAPDAVFPDSGDPVVLYVSRYYPHKQHRFLLQLVDRYKTQLRNKKVKFYITVDQSRANRQAAEFLNNIAKQGLDDIIHNLGEIPNERLPLYYRTARCFFFPSTDETFGNPLVEAMAFGLPVVVPKLNYATEVCGDAGFYYEVNNTEDAFDRIMTLLENQPVREEFSRRSRLRFQHFPTTDKWVDGVFALASC